MAEIVARNGNDLTIQVTIKLTGSLMEMENTILDSFNEMGCLATTEALKIFDTDGSPIKLGDTKMTVRDKDNKTYQTPYGSVQLERYVYQTSKGAEFIALWNTMRELSGVQRQNLPNNCRINMPT